MKFDRRNFLKTAAAGAATCFVKARGQEARIDGHIEVLIEEPVATIAPEIYGHFIEHLGGVIYDGVWVGRDSKVPNVEGIRRSAIEMFKGVNAPVIRWPGGCFADSYDWQDGIGTSSERKVRTNFWGGSDTNAFGTLEFIRLCELTGAKPYFAANLRGLPARDFNRWVEFCNSPVGSTDASKRRAALGHPAPFGVRYWGVGNESWGCGGNFTPEDYATEFRRFTAWIPEYGPHLFLVASGPSDHDISWTRRFMNSMAEKHQTRTISGLSLHYYTWNVSAGTTTDWDAGKGDGLNFNELEWYEMLTQGYDMNAILNEHWAVLRETDPQHHVKLIVDEWGAWYKPGTEIAPEYKLSQGSTMRDALLTGLTLDVFHRNAEKIAMANVAQSINCLHSLLLAKGDQSVLTPAYHVFRMYQPHMGATAVRTEFAAPPVTYDRHGKPASLWGLNGSASISNKRLTLTVVNPHISRPVETEIVVRGASIQSGTAMVLTAKDIHAHNDFANLNAVHSAEEHVEAHLDRVVHKFPPASVTALYLTLA
jgi:alpha-N-arabinofuranosidase